MARAARPQTSATTGGTKKNRGGRPKRVRSDAGLASAIDKAGSIGRLAAITGVTVGAVSIWKQVPRKAVNPISDALGIARHVLRPDLFDPLDQPILRSQ